MFFHSYQGIIALDIDGTITSETHSVHPDVVRYFTSLQDEGWIFMFITGRPFQWGYEVLKSFPFPYVFVVQNGALVLEMPARKVIDKKYLRSDILPLMENICLEEKTDFIVYSGFESQDWCYYRPTHLPSPLLAYLQQRVEALEEKWQPLSSFHSLPVSLFSSLKCFAQGDQAQRLSQRIEKELSLHAPVNRDPFNPHYFVIQATHIEATKGKALEYYRHQFPSVPVVIAAGDDYNDLSMLQKANIRVVMATAPADLKQWGDIIAPPASENGIIKGLKQAIEQAQNRRWPHA